MKVRNHYTYEIICEKFAEQGYKVLSPKEDYQNTQSKLLIEKNGYKSYMEYSNFYLGRKPKFFSYKHNPFFLDNAKIMLYNIDTTTEVLSYDVVKRHNHNEYICIINMKCSCGNLFSKKWGDIKSNKYLKCPICAKKYRGQNHRKSKNEAIKFIKSKGYKIISIPQDFIRTSKVEVQNKDGFYGFISYSALHSGKNMSIFDIRSNKKHYIKNINILASKYGIETKAIDFYDTDKYTRQPILFQCQCGCQFVTSVASFQNGKWFCDNCSKQISSYERIIQQFLDEQHIDYIYQYRINSCKDILPLPFDFYLIQSKKIIEVDGEGHYHVAHFNHCSDEKAHKTFDMTTKHDKIKNDYCQKYNIPLLRIPYWDIKNSDNYKQIISNFLKE